MTENRLFFRFVNFLKAINCWKVSLVYSNTVPLKGSLGKI